MTDVKGMKTAVHQAEEGLKLFEAEAEIKGDVAAATKYKEEIDAKMAAIDKEVEALPGKENAKARSEKGKAKMALKNLQEYTDACKVVKGLAPIHGHFVIGGAPPKVVKTKSDPVQEVADDMPAAKGKESKSKGKKAESAGISKAERDELESLKKQIIERKAALKEEGLTGGQINKDEQVAAWVTRMNELKLKENPDAADAKDEKKAGKKKLNSQVTAELAVKQKELEDYANQLKADFKYSKKEIMADPDYIEMKAVIDKMSK